MNEPVDIIAAIVDYLQAVMGQSLLSATGYTQVYADWAPANNPDGSPVIQPYAVVHDGPEMYKAQSQDPATGYPISVIADGTALVAFHGTTKAQVRALGRIAVRIMSDTVVQLIAQDARFITLLAPRSDSVPSSETGIGQPSQFIRVVTCQYQQQFGE